MTPSAKEEHEKLEKAIADNYMELYSDARKIAKELVNAYYKDGMSDKKANSEKVKHTSTIAEQYLADWIIDGLYYGYSEYADGHYTPPVVHLTP